MHRFLIAPVLAAALFATAGMATAASHANNGGSHGTAVANSNGVRSLDRDRGLERAAERRNTPSLTTKRTKKIQVSK